LRENARRLVEEMPERFGGLRLEEYAALDGARRARVTELEEKRRRRNELSAVRGKPSPEAIAEMKTLKDAIHDLERETEEADAALVTLEQWVPNVPHPSVPRGPDASANRVERTWGAPRAFAFTAQAHWDLGPALGVLDFERGAKLAGSRFTVLFGAGARLSRALMNFFLDVHVREQGYTEVVTPVMVNAESLFGTSQLPKFEDDLFKTREGYYLIS